MAIVPVVSQAPSGGVRLACVSCEAALVHTGVLFIFVFFPTSAQKYEKVKLWKNPCVAYSQGLSQEPACSLY